MFRRPYRILAFVVCQTGLVLAQTGEFDAASVKHSVPDETRLLRSDSGWLIYTNVSLRDYIMEAYGVRDFQVIGPDWLVTERYDITATFPPTASQEERNIMLQKLLISRFGISFHRETRDISVYAMTTPKNGAGLHVAGEQEKSDMRTIDGGFSFTHMNVGQLIYYLRLLRLVDRPVVDLTDRSGAYDIVLNLYPTNQELIAAMNSGTLGSAVAVAIKDYGFQLEPKKLPVEVLIIDRAEKTPPEN